MSYLAGIVVLVSKDRIIWRITMDINDFIPAQFENLDELARDALHHDASDANNSLNEAAFLDRLSYPEAQIAGAFDGKRNDEGEIDFDFDMTHDAADECISSLSTEEKITMINGLGFSDEQILIEIG